MAKAGQRAQPLLPPRSIFQTLGAEHIHPVFLWKTRLITSLLLSTKEEKGLPHQGPDWARHSPEVTQQNPWQIQRLWGRTPGPVPSASVCVPLLGAGKLLIPEDRRAEVTRPHTFCSICSLAHLVLTPTPRDSLLSPHCTVMPQTE